MSAWAAKRFWTDVGVVQEGGGFAIRLDSRAVKTPAKAPMIVPTHAMAQAIADEWAVVDGVIDPTVMPFTRSANAAIDKVAVQIDEVVNMLAAYGGSDLLCYRAHGPAELVERQNSAWDSLLDWVDETYNARLAVTVGIMPIMQPEDALTALHQPLKNATAFEIAALHDLIAMSGSLVLAYAVTQRRLSAKDAWALSRIDEKWQAEHWGTDEDAEQVSEIKRLAFNHAADFYFLAEFGPQS